MFFFLGGGELDADHCSMMLCTVAYDGAVSYRLNLYALPDTRTYCCCCVVVWINSIAPFSCMVCLVLLLSFVGVVVSVVVVTIDGDIHVSDTSYQAPGMIYDFPALCFQCFSRRPAFAQFYIRFFYLSAL